MRWVPIALLAANSWAQPVPEASLLARVRQRMRDNMLRLPNYTCLETVERTRQLPGGGPPVQDILRLEVALADRKEMFAWPGAEQFDDREVMDMVGKSGMFGNGNYGTYTRLLFLVAGPQFVYRGEAPLRGKPAARFDFEMKAPENGFRLRVGAHEALVSFRGSIYADPVTADLRRLEVTAEDIPQELELSLAEDTVDYARSKIGDEEFLVPTDSSLRMVTKDADSRNRVRFSACRKFAGESKIIFDDPDTIEAAKAAPIREVTLPRDTMLPIEIRSDVKLPGSAVGDVVTAVLTGDVKDGKEKIAPKGAALTGRIVQLQWAGTTYTLGIHFTDLTWPGGHAAVNAAFERAVGLGSTARSYQALADGSIRIVPPAPGNLKRGLFFWRTAP